MYNIEQVQFENNLLVDYDILQKNFRVPPLTLQPIVGNAVKHGMDPEYSPLCIVIRTRQKEFGNEIIVEKNSSGFDFKFDDNKKDVTTVVLTIS